MTKRKSTRSIALLTALVLISSLFLGVSIARYVTSTNSEDEARVAIWGINEGGTDMDLFNNVYEMPDGTIIAESSGGEEDKIIAPGTSNESQFKILTASSVRPEVMYEVKINLDDSEMPDEIKNHPGIQWKLDNGNYGTWDELKLSLYNLVGNDTGVAVFEPGKVSTELANGVTHTIGWQWVMDSGYDAEDTRLGNLAAEGTPVTAKVVVEITAQQTNVDSTGMLYGNGSVYNTNDPQPLMFRADADYSTFKDVEINDTTLNPSNYTPANGSIKITLKKEYLETLPLGEHKITINTTDGKAIESMFTVTDSTTIVHNGIIPEGGTYYSDIPFPYGEDQPYWFIGDYLNAENVYNSNEEFPTPQTGDMYKYGDYLYAYNCFRASGDGSIVPFGNNEWLVIWLGNSSSSFDKNILTQIANKNIKDMNYTFSYNYVYDFITDFPIIPITVESMESTFYGQTELPETIELNTKNLTNYTNMLFGTSVSWISGSISNELKQAIATASNITLPTSPDVHNNKIPTGGTYYTGSTKTYYADLDASGYVLGDYPNATAYNTGTDFPTLNTGDAYIYGDYEYRYNCLFDPASMLWTEDDNINGWGVRVLDSTKTNYCNILTTINNKNIIEMEYTFGNCDNLIIAPTIPNTVTQMGDTFMGCNSLTKAPIIPPNVTFLSSTFYNCTSLTGNIEINSNPTSYEYALYNTQITEITGSTTLKEEILATKTQE